MFLPWEIMVWPKPDQPDRLLRPWYNQTRRKCEVTWEQIHHWCIVIEFLIDRSASDLNYLTSESHVTSMHHNVLRLDWFAFCLINFCHLRMFWIQYFISTTVTTFNHNKYNFSFIALSIHKHNYNKKDNTGTMAE